MVDLLMCGLVVAGILAMIGFPLAVLELMRVTRERIELERRNGAQAVVIAEYRLRESRAAEAHERYERECG